MLGIYCRISQLKEEGKDRSIHDQKQLGIEFAQSINSEYKIYIDEGVSGTLPIGQRPELERMLEDIEEGLIDSVYVYMQDRLERNTRVRFLIRSIFERNNVTLYTSSGKVDGNDDEQTLMGDIFSLVNEWEVKKTRKRVKSVLYRNAKEGIYQGIVPYGYTKTEDKVHIVHDKEAKVVQKIYDLSLQGKGVAKIAEILNDEGIPTRYNKLKDGTLSTRDKYSGEVRTVPKSSIKWSGTTIYGILNNSSYKGEKLYNGEVLPYPIIINPVQWDRVKKNLKNNRNNSGKQVQHKYLLKGKIVCGVCGRNYYGRTRVNKKDNFYMCSSKRRGEENCGNRSINIGVSESFIWDRFFVDGVLKNKTREHYALNSPEKSIQKLKKEIHSIEKRIKGLKKERSRISELLIKEIFDEEDAQTQLETNRKKTSELNLDLQGKQNELQYHIDCINDLEYYTQDLDNLQSNAHFSDKKKLIDKYLKKIVVKYIPELKTYHLIIYFNIPEIDKEQYFIDVNYSVASGSNSLTGEDIIIPLSEKAKTLSTEELKDRMYTYKYGKYLDKPMTKLTIEELVKIVKEIRKEIKASEGYIDEQKEVLEKMKEEYNSLENPEK